MSPNDYISVRDGGAVRRYGCACAGSRARRVGSLTIGLALLAGAALGAAGVRGLQTAHLLRAEIDVSNPEAYAAEYAPKAQAIIKSHGGRQLAIGGSGAAGAAKLTAFDGEPPKRAVVQVWDSMEKIQAWRNDPQYKALREEVGAKYAKFRSYAIEGLPQ